MDEFEKHVQKACSYPRGSKERNKQLNEVICRIQQSGKLWRGEGVHDYEDALQQTWLYFCRNLCEATTGDRYDPQRASVMTWLNAYLKARLYDRRLSAYFDNNVKAEPMLSKDGELLDPLDLIQARPDPPPILEEIREWLEIVYSTQLQPLQVLVDRLHESQVVRLRQWLEGIYEAGWQTIEQLSGESTSAVQHLLVGNPFTRLFA